MDSLNMGRLLFLAASLLLLRHGWMHESFELRMPDVLPTIPDAYLCHAYTIPSDETWYITSIGPILVDSAAVHHVIVITCPVLNSDSPAWSCEPPYDGAFPKAPICEEANSQFMYDWTEGVPEFHFPKGVGFRVGGGGDYRNLVVQVHYSAQLQFNESFRDSSGVNLTFTRDRTPMLAGLTSVGADGSVLPKHLESFESACVVHLPQDTTLRVISFLVHTHHLGLLVTGYRERDGVWTEIGQRQPQLPKEFTPADVTLQEGDTIFVRCFMYNFLDHAVSTGQTHHDEMCLIRLLYYAENGEFVPAFECQPKSSE